MDFITPFPEFKLEIVIGTYFLLTQHCIEQIPIYSCHQIHETFTTLLADFII